MTDPWLLQRLEAEAALMAHHVEHGVAPPRPVRVCRNGHTVTVWDDHPHDGCVVCRRIGANRRQAA